AVRAVAAAAAGGGATLDGAGGLLAGLVLAAVALLQYEWSRRRPPAGEGPLAEWDPREGVRAASLAAAIGGAYIAIRAASVMWSAGGEFATATQTVAASALAATFVWAGVRRGLGDWLAMGAVALAALAAKAVLYDAFVLPAGLAMVSVAAAGAGLAVVAFGLRRRRGR
ncbi:MAG: hypothetical protein HY907_01865, partial [Deltaproteobacteria bacterium]|nr:hypothetical protein [Deltaproteobacteria bacterium]